MQVWFLELKLGLRERSCVKIRYEVHGLSFSSTDLDSEPDLRDGKRGWSKISVLVTLPLEMGDGNGSLLFGRACDRQRKDREDVWRGGEVRQESQRDDVISKVFQIDGPESDVEH